LNKSDRDFLRKTNHKLERRSRVRRKEEKGSPASQQNDPPRKTEVKRFLKPTKKELKTQEGKIFLKFTETYSQRDLTLAAAEAIWTFIVFLKESGYHIIDEQTVFSFPFSRMVKLKNLK